VITNNNQTEVNFDFYDDVFFPTIIELCMCLENVQNVKKTKLDSRTQGGTWHEIYLFFLAVCLHNYFK
jgi:hypothetical protein